MYPTIEELRAAGQQIRTTYAGPMELDYAQGLAQRLGEKHYPTGQAYFPGLQIVRQDTGYNLVYQDEGVKEWRPTGVKDLDDLIARFCTGKQLTDCENHAYVGFTTGDWWGGAGRHLPKSFFEQTKWADGGYRVVWTSPSLRAVFSYCEGDICLVVCDDDRHYQWEVARIGASYGAMYVPHDHQ